MSDSDTLLDVANFLRGTITHERAKGKKTFKKGLN